MSNDKNEMIIEKIDKEQIYAQVKSAFGDEFIVDNSGNTTPWSPSFRHILSGHRFRYIPSGQFSMGLSKQEEIAAQAIFSPIPANESEMRPVHIVRVSPFLMAERPVVTKEISGEQSSHPDSAAYVSYEEALNYCKKWARPRMGLVYVSHAVSSYRPSRS